MLMGRNGKVGDFMFVKEKHVIKVMKIQIHEGGN